MTRGRTAFLSPLSLRPQPKVQLLVNNIQKIAVMRSPEGEEKKKNKEKKNKNKKNTPPPLFKDFLRLDK
jgi:hypothetical protein